jgi:predicted nucleotide-binding protein
VEKSLARIDQNIFQAIWNKVRQEQPNITRKAIYDRIKSVRKEFGNAIPPRMAANVLASNMGIDVYRIIKNKSELEELRDLRSRTLMRDLLKETLPQIVPKKRKAIAPKKPSKKVFIVHGRDYSPVKELKFILTKFGLKPIVLHEQPSGSRTIVEKLEKYSDVGYAFVVLTPDDIGSDIESLSSILSSPDKLNLEDIFEMKLAEKRARQNVVLEFGYFVGKLGRDHVCCLHKGDIELPSDMHGIVYIPFEKSVNERRDTIVTELKAAGYDINPRQTSS